MTIEHDQAADASAEFIEHIECKACGSSDANAVYADGHTYCFGCHKVTRPGELVIFAPTPGTADAKGLISDGTYRALTKRGLTAETCRKWRYQVATYSDSPVQVANYYTAEGSIVGQKVRWPNKDFRFLGKPKNPPLYGMWLWRDGGKMVVVTEGEIDALSVSQLQGNKWPVVSLPNGAAGAKKSLQNNLEWLERYDSIILMFDSDEAGKAAIEECVPLFTPGKVKVATLPLKDANEMLLAGRGGEVIDAIWGAKVYRPDGVVTIGDLRERLSQPLDIGLSWPWSRLTELTYGIRLAEMYTLGAGTGLGKSEVWKEVMIHLAYTHGQTVGGIFLEELPTHTVRCLAGKMDNKLYHIPNAQWRPEEFMETVDRLDQDQRVFLYDHFGHTDYDTIKARIRYMVVSLGCKYIFLDHVTALVSGDREGDERKQLDFIMTDLASLLRELNFTLFLISHLTTPEGKPHEEGGRVMVRHFRGSRAIGQWSNFVFGLERDQQNEDEARRHISCLRVLKDRYSGRATGSTLFLSYDSVTGRLAEVDDPDLEAAPASNPFDDDIF